MNAVSTYLGGTGCSVLHIPTEKLRAVCLYYTYGDRGSGVFPTRPPWKHSQESRVYLLRSNPHRVQWALLLDKQWLEHRRNLIKKCTSGLRRCQGQKYKLKGTPCLCLLLNPPEPGEGDLAGTPKTWRPSLRRSQSTFPGVGLTPGLLRPSPPPPASAPFLLDFFLCRPGFGMCRLITFNFSFACYRCLSRCSQGNLDRGSWKALHLMP